MVRSFESLDVLSLCVYWARAYLGVGPALLSRAGNGPNPCNLMSNQGDAHNKRYTKNKKTSRMFGNNGYTLPQFGAGGMAP